MDANSLKRDTILNSLESCYLGQAGTLDTNKGGAGRGLFRIIDNIKPFSH